MIGYFSPTCIVAGCPLTLRSESRVMLFAEAAVSDARICAFDKPTPMYVVPPPKVPKFVKPVGIEGTV